MGGFVLPFLVVGMAGLVVATALLVLIPNVRVDTPKSGEDRGSDQEKRLTFGSVSRHPSILLPFLDNLTCFFGNGLVVALMSPHLIRAGANQAEVAFAYVCFGAAFATGAVLAGKVRDFSRKKYFQETNLN